MTSKIDFALLDRLREAMLLDIPSMAKFLGVSRQMYYLYLNNGAQPRVQKGLEIKSKFKTMASMYKQGAWPTEHSKTLDYKARLLRFMADYDLHTEDGKRK